MSHRAIITGASRGIGRAIAKKLTEEGSHVIGLARSFNDELPNFTPLAIDLADLDALPEKFKVLSKEFPDVDTLVCNAGQGLFGNLEELSYGQIQNLMQVNFLSHVFLIKTFLPQMKKAKKGNIILIGSEAALAGKRQGSIYCASKFALRGFSQALREECAGKGIRVTLINPGMVRTGFFDDLHFIPGEQEHESIVPEDIAEIVQMILNTRQGTVLDEINLSPQSKKVVFR